MNSGVKKGLVLILSLLGIYFAVQYLLPLALPFLLGAALAWVAEPVVVFFTDKLRLPRGLSAGIGVSLVFLFLAMVLLLLCGLLVRQLGRFAGILPDMEQTLRTGLDSLCLWLLEMVGKMPEGIQTLLSQYIYEIFSGGAELLDRIFGWLLSLATGMLSRIPDRALLVGTGMISCFMISAKLPKIRNFLKKRIPMESLRPVLESVKKLKEGVFGWIRAQAKLCGLTFLIVWLGLLIMGIPNGIFWAAAIALVDALPVLGAGTALVPWSVVSFLQGDRIQAFGLLGTYAAAAVLRSVMEPRLVGKQLGLDPLLTLAALYAGYRLWGLIGMILAPMLAVIVAQMTELRTNRS